MLPVPPRPRPRQTGSLFLLALAVLASGLWPTLARANPVVNLLVSESGSFYQEAAATLAQSLGREGWKVNVSTIDRQPANGGALTVAIGTKALETALARPERPVLSLLVPRLTFERLAAGHAQVSALYLDQPLTRQLQLLRLALPGLKTAGVPLGPSSQELKASLQSAARESGIQVNSAVISQSADLYPVLTDMAEDSEAFLLLPDPLVAERSTLHNFLLHTYRLRKPVLAYSAPLTRSGALLSLYSTPSQAGREAASWIMESLYKNEIRLGVARYPKSFTIGINRTVSHSLDIALPSEEALVRDLEALQ